MTGKYGVPPLSEKEKELIKTIDSTWDRPRALAELESHLQLAIKVELATIPIYLYAYYSVCRKPGVDATLAAALWAPARLSPLARGTVLAIAGSLFVALCAQITVPFWPVPMTGQTFAVLSVGLVCGWRIGGAALLLYLLEGVVGLPFFAGGEAGWAAIAGPSGGYIVGFRTRSRSSRPTSSSRASRRCRSCSPSAAHVSSPCRCSSAASAS